jgi:hypothetical protein
MPPPDARCSSNLPNIRSLARLLEYIGVVTLNLARTDGLSRGQGAFVIQNNSSG